MNNQKPPKGIAIVILIMLALLCLRCEENEPCSVYDELRCNKCEIGDKRTTCLEHCVDGKWEVMIDCKASIGDDAVCIDRAHEEATCAIIGG